MKTTFTLAALALVALTAVGCAANAEADDVSTAAGEASELEASDPITIQNWLRHPKIEEVRAIVDAIDAADYEAESKMDLCVESGHGESERTVLVDGDGVIRELVLASGSEDSFEIHSHYYDAQGRLRFVLKTRNDVHGSSWEYRTYFDETGARIWDVSRSASTEAFHPDLEHAPYEVVADEAKSDLDPTLATPAVRYDAPEQCD